MQGKEHTNATDFNAATRPEKEKNAGTAAEMGCRLSYGNAGRPAWEHAWGFGMCVRFWKGREGRPAAPFCHITGKPHTTLLLRTLHLTPDFGEEDTDHRFRRAGLYESLENRIAVFI